MPASRREWTGERTGGEAVDSRASTRLVVVGGNTDTARIEGISAAGADPRLRAHTPAADLEIVEYGRTALSPVVPVSPGGCPTPAVGTRAAREVVGFAVLAVDAGLAKPTGAPTVELGATPGGDVRVARPVPAAREVYDRGRRLGAALPDDRIAIGETIPGGTTTARAVLAALGERQSTSSSLPENPVELKARVVETALERSDLSPGAGSGDPVGTLERVGDPVLAAAAGIAVGALQSGTEVLLAGGTQMAAVAGLVRHAGVEAPLTVATTAFVAADDSADLSGLASDLDLDLVATDPAFDGRDHPATAAYLSGAAKEGVGFGGALAMADRRGVPVERVTDRFLSVYDRIVEGNPGDPTDEIGGDRTDETGRTRSNETGGDRT